MLRRSLSSGSFTPLTSSKSFGSLKRRKSDAAKPTALVSSLLTSKTGTVVELLGGSDKSWLLEIYADEDELAAQLTHHAPSSAAAIKIVRLIASGVGAQFEALVHLASKDGEQEIQRATECCKWSLRLVQTSRELPRPRGPDDHSVHPDWWNYWQVVLDPLEPGHRPFDPEDALHQPGKGLAGKTVWYHLLPETSGNNHCVDQCSLSSNDDVSSTPSGPVLRPGSSVQLPANPTNFSRRPSFGLSAGFYCQNTAFNQTEGREQSMWRWYWGVNSHAPKPATEGGDFGGCFPGRMTVGPNSALVVWRGPVKVTHPLPRTESQKGDGRGTLRKMFTRRNSSRER